MMTIKTMSLANFNDADLVGETLAGNREAYAQIVSRYQSLVCSIAYSATGSLAHSEDLAQDTFVTAWKKLSQLREREKLRPWLCGIARNLVCNALRKQGREPSHEAEALDEIAEVPSPQPEPAAQTISNEELAILWRSLEKIPEIYREPLVLFYREHQSAAVVAEKLDLTEDTVNQRLSRGRKLLQEQVLAFVQGALERTNPSQAFTLGVMAVLPSLTFSAKAATLGAAAVKGSVTAKAAAATGLIGAILNPLIGLGGMWLGYKIAQDSAGTERERAFNRAFYQRLSLCVVGFMLMFVGLMTLGGRLINSKPIVFAGLVLGVAGGYVVAIVYYSIWCYRTRRKLLANLTAAEMATRPTQPIWEYCSAWRLLGLPLIHIRMGDRMGEPVKAWIAAGDYAFGGLFAFGGLAVAPVSIGGCAVGLFTFGGMSIGMLELGGFGLGVWAFGGLVVGWQAFGGCALALNAAWGGYAIAGDFALGGIAHAAQMNNKLASEFMNANWFFRISNLTLPYLFWLNLLWFIPLVAQWRVTANKRRNKLISS